MGAGAAAATEWGPALSLTEGTAGTVLGEWPEAATQAWSPGWPLLSSLDRSPRPRLVRGCPPGGDTTPFLDAVARSQARTTGQPVLSGQCTRDEPAE